MSSNVLPYFILTPANSIKPSHKQVEQEHIRQKDLSEATPPITPAPSGVSNPLINHAHRKGKVRRRLVRCEIPVKDLRKRETLTKKMELIKRKLESSRERINEKKMDVKNDIRCEPNMQSAEGNQPMKLERALTDLTHDRITSRQKQTGSNPYFYFVVSDDRDSELVLENGERISSKSADKKRRVRIVEENRLKRDRRERQKKTAKMQGLARELGLKSSLKNSNEGSDSVSPNSGKVQPAVNHIVFQGPPCEEATFIRGKLRVISSPPGVPGSQSTNQSADSKIELQADDSDETVPRKPFLSSPLYEGKKRIQHAVSTSLFELPTISAEQKRRALGLSSSTRFEEFAYNAKPRHEQRAVSFAEPLPGIRGNAFSFDAERDDLDQPSLGPRAATLGSIKLHSERTDQQTLCQKFAMGEHIGSARSVRKFGVPLSLPKIDIVSNVYDEMIIKMIQEYLQDTNTPSRQSQLAKDLLVQLQKHNEHMKEMNVPNLRTGRNGKIELARHLNNRHLINQVPPNTAEDTKRPHPVLPLCDISDDKVEHSDETKGGNVNGNADESNPETPSIDPQRDIPFVQITFKNKENGGEELDGTDGCGDTSEKPPMSKNSSRSKMLRDGKPCRSPVTPVSFKMAPPGLSKEDTQSSIQLRAN